MIDKYGYVYLVYDETGIKIGSSGENNVEDRIQSVMRNRGTGTCKVIGKSTKKYRNYRSVEKWSREEAELRFDLPPSINEWHNFKHKEKITPELLSGIMKIINTFEELDL